MERRSLLYWNRAMHTNNYNDIIMSAMASQITSLTIIYSTVYSNCKSKKTSKLRVTGLCAGNSPVTGEFPAQRASNAENVSIWWRHHELPLWCNTLELCWVKLGPQSPWKSLASYCVQYPDAEEYPMCPRCPVRLMPLCKAYSQKYVRKTGIKVVSHTATETLFIIYLCLLLFCV